MSSDSSIPNRVIPPSPAHLPADVNTGVLDTLPPPISAIGEGHREKGALSAQENGLTSPPPIHSRMPPTTPILLPEHRYCYRDGFVKPPRAHHCRACGTCVLRYDHHCPCEFHFEFGQSLPGDPYSNYHQQGLVNALEPATIK
jgi:palmitoyltransferase